MPTYEYGCPKCGTFEATQRITDRPLRRCPTCKGKVTKLISATSFQLKGSGWYVSDYGGKKPETKEKAEGKSDSTSGSEAKDSKDSAVAKSDTKTETKTESKTPAKSEATAA